MKKGIISLFTLTVLLFSLLFSGCSGNNAKDTANAMCSLIFKYKLEDGEKFGITENQEEELINEYQEEIKNQFKQNLSMVGYNPTDSELDPVCDAYKEALSKISYEAKEVSKSGDEAEVEITTNNIDMKEIDAKAAMDALDETDSLDSATIQEENDKYAKAYIQKMAENLKNAEASSERYTNKFKFKKVDKFWVPDDPKNFGYKLVRLATNKDNYDLNIDEEIATPEESAEALWSLIVKQDSSAIKKLGYSEALGERLIKNIKKTDFDTFKAEFSQLNLNLSDEQLQEMVDSLEQAIGKTSVRFEEVSKTDSSAQVKVYSTSIDLNSIIRDTVETTKTQAISSGMTTQEQVLQAYFSNLITSVKNAQPSTVESNKTFMFKKVGDTWLPSDTEDYSYGIGQLAMQ